MSTEEKPVPAALDAIRDKRILIVDDDYYFRTVLEKNLIRRGHRAGCAENAKNAQQIIGLEEYDLVISDIRMPDMDGIELLKWIKANHPKIPVILMTGFSEIEETHQAVELGASGFLAKPFKTEDLIETIAACFPAEAGLPENGDADLDPQFSRISLDDFVSGHQIKFDIYIRITAKKYIKIAHGGENLPADRIQAYKKKNITFLHMRKEDFRKYLSFNLKVSHLVTHSKSIEHQKKINFLRHTTEVMLQNLYTTELTRDDFVQAGALVENAVSLLSDDSDAAELLASLSGHTDHLYAHSVGVSLYASLIGKALGWSSPAIVFKLSLGGLLHDVGKKEIAREILDRPRKDLKPEEIAILERHTLRGAQILGALPCVPTDIVQIAHEHHENCMGFGYPLGLKKMKIHPFARVVAVADEFCKLALKNPNSPNGMPAHEAIQQIISLNAEYYDREALNALMKIFGYLPKTEEEKKQRSA
jgi:putative nucleotidyltransferase with HDIG domain